MLPPQPPQHAALTAVNLYSKQQPSGAVYGGDDGGGEEEYEEDSMTELMELDIISFDEEDIAYSCSAAAIQQQQQQQQADANCFNFEWAAAAGKSLCGGARANTDAQLGNYYYGGHSAPAGHHPQQQHQHQQQRMHQQPPHNAHASSSRHMFGLEAWGCNKPQQQPHSFDSHHPHPHHQQQQPAGYQHSLGGGMGHYPQQARPPRSLNDPSDGQFR